MTWPGLEHGGEKYYESKVSLQHSDPGPGFEAGALCPGFNTVNRYISLLTVQHLDKLHVYLKEILTIQCNERHIPTTALKDYETKSRKGE